MWDLESARKFINIIQPFCKRDGYFCCLYGSVLYNGFSNKDLDLQIISYLGIDKSETVKQAIILNLGAVQVGADYHGILNTLSFLIQLPDDRVVDIIIRTDKKSV